MSIGTKIPLEAALQIAKALVDDLAPVCAQTKVVGSVRRRRPYCGDIEILVEPNMLADLFGGQSPDVASIRKVAESWGTIVKGADRMIQVQTAMQDARVDLYLVHPPSDWWVQMAIRTGPAPLGQLAVTRMRAFGYRCEHGHIVSTRGAGPFVCTGEADFFRAAGLPCLPASRRDMDAARRPVEAMEGV